MIDACGFFEAIGFFATGLLSAFGAGFAGAFFATTFFAVAFFGVFFGSAFLAANFFAGLAALAEDFFGLGFFCSALLQLRDSGCDLLLQSHSAEG